MFSGIRLDGADNLGIINQPVDQHLPLGQLERAYFDIQAGTDLIEHPVYPPAQEPAGAGDQNSIKHGYPGDNHQQCKKPNRDSDLPTHAGTPSTLRACQYLVVLRKYGVDLAKSEMQSTKSRNKFKIQMTKTEFY